MIARRLDVVGVIVSDLDRAIDFCDSPQGVDRVYRELVEAGAESHRAPWDAFWGQRYAEVKDPDGNVVDLFAPLA